MNTSPPSVATKHYRKAEGAVERYKKAIAVLHRKTPLSPELVRGVLHIRDKAYSSVRQIPGVWLARSLCALWLIWLDFLLWLANGLPKPMCCWLVRGIRQLDRPWWSAPKPLRVLFDRSRRIGWINQIGVLTDSIGLVKTVKELDSQLYEQVEWLNQHTTQIPSHLWEQLQFPPVRDVWGLLTPPKPLPWRDRLDGVWEFLSVVLLTASFAILLDISARLFSSGADARGIQAIIIPSLLTLLAGGGLTKRGREFLGRIFDNLGVPRHWRDEFIFLSILILFLSISQAWRGLPDVGRQQTQLGHQAMCLNPLTSHATENCDRQLARAEGAYNLAIKLDPDNSEAHYGLGTVFEALQINQDAIAQYQLAVKGEVRGISYDAYARLSRLYVLQGQKDDSYIKAIALSRDGLDRLLKPRSIVYQRIPPEARKDIEYSLYKNLGWAYLVGQENYAEAETVLLHARDLIYDRAPAHCLLAQVNEAANDLSQAEINWERCAAFAKGTDRDEERWNSQARERLTQMRYEDLIRQGQIWLERQDLPKAEKVLQDAIALTRGRAPAYCLLAEVEERTNQLRRAKSHWELCQDYARQNQQDQENWLTLARDRLSRLRDRLTSQEGA